ncbi:MAG: metallophosphoesterase [Myxococcota bacterium]
MGPWLVLACSAPETAPAAAPAPVPAANSIVRPAPIPPTSAPAEGAVYAVGDLHGDLDNAIAALHLAGVVDAGGHWTGGAAVLVQTGDVLDRGPDGRTLLAWQRALSAEAAAAGGRVVSLLGNHEVMNLRGDWRYVVPGDVEQYGGADARRSALSPAGEDGRWLRSLDSVARVGDTVFVHGGVRASFAPAGAEGLSSQVRAALDQVEEAPILGEQGPLWYRGYVTDPEAAACPELHQALAALGARRMVVGHTTRRDGKIEARCGGALVVIDVGVADAYGGKLAVLELRPGADAWGVYPSGPVDLPDPVDP